MILLYHTGYQVLREPDIHYGRKNADFGQGFYLTADGDFARRWAQERKGMQVTVNLYQLDTEGLRIKRLSRDRAWYDYLTGNRALRPDRYADWDVIEGPIANDTLFNTSGIITSGFLSPAESLALLSVGPEYRQTVIKTERAAKQLHWLSAEPLDGDAIGRTREALRREEERYLTELARVMAGLSEDGGSAHPTQVSTDCRDMQTRA